MLTFNDTEEKAGYLAASPGRVFTKAQIFESVWSMESTGSTADLFAELMEG